MRSGSRCCVTRTTLNIDADLLEQLKRYRRRPGKTLGARGSELLASALSDPPVAPARRLRWITRDLGARVDRSDKEALRRALAER